MTTTYIGLLTIIIAIASYGIYIRDTIKGRTRPHAISWVIWAVLNGFIFTQQLIHGAGPGAWVTGVAAAANVLIVLLSLKYGERNITRIDWLCLVISGAVLALWLQNVNDTLTVSLACIVFVVGFIPTFRKSFRKPGEETVATFGLNSIKFFLALFALNQITLVTALYPFVLGLMNGSFVIFLIIRRIKLGSKLKSKKGAKYVQPS